MKKAIANMLRAMAAPLVKTAERLDPWQPPPPEVIEKFKATLETFVNKTIDEMLEEESRG